MKQMNQIRLREYVSHDYPAIMGLWELTNLSTPERGDTEITIGKSIKMGGKFWVLEDLSTDEIVGSCWVTNDSRRLYLHHLGIHPRYQQKGYGRMMSEKALKFAKELNMQIKLEVHAGNTNAVKLYKNLGFDDLDGYGVMIKRKH